MWQRAFSAFGVFLTVLNIVNVGIDIQTLVDARQDMVAMELLVEDGLMADQAVEEALFEENVRILTAEVDMASGVVAEVVGTSAGLMAGRVASLSIGKAVGRSIVTAIVAEKVSSVAAGASVQKGLDAAAGSSVASAGDHLASNSRLPPVWCKLTALDSTEFCGF